MTISGNNPDRWMQILASVITMLICWLCYRSVTHDAQIQSQQYQIGTILQTQQNVIPPVIEASLRELRDKTNADRDLILAMSQRASDNQKDISFIRQQLEQKVK